MLKHTLPNTYLLLEHFHLVSHQQVRMSKVEPHTLASSPPDPLHTKPTSPGASTTSSCSGFTSQAPPALLSGSQPSSGWASSYSSPSSSVHVHFLYPILPEHWTREPNYTEWMLWSNSMIYTKFEENTKQWHLKAHPAKDVWKATEGQGTHQTIWLYRQRMTEAGHVCNQTVTGSQSNHGSHSKCPEGTENRDQRAERRVESSED